MSVYFITGNENKFKEASFFISNLKQVEIDLVEIQDIDPKNVIEHKLKEAFKHKQAKYIVEDTSLFINGMNGLPGTLTKWFLKTIDNQGIYKLAQSFGNEAIAVTMIGYLESSTKIKYFKGEVNGKIVKPRGETGFGWDNIFMPNGYDKTFSEMLSNEKNKISMRKIAFQKLKKYLNANE